ncbi:M20 family metallopeptidase [Prescottella equi]
MDIPATSTALLARCVDAIDTDRLTDTLVRLIELPSVNPFGEPPTSPVHGEGRVAAYMADRLEGLGWVTNVIEYEPGRFNVVCESPGSGTSENDSIMFAGHMDTVQVDGYEDAFRGRVAAGRIHGRGAVDMKAALACYIEVAEALAATHTVLPGKLYIAGVGDEEFRQEGAKSLGRSGLRVGGIVIGEPTELRICKATKGLAAYDLNVTGLATHSSVPDHGENAILQMAQLLGGFSSYTESLRAIVHPLLGSPTVNVGTIAGGLKPNIVPSECITQLSRRLLPGEDAESVKVTLAKALSIHANPSTNWRISDAWWTVDPYELAESSRLSTAIDLAAAADDIDDTTPTGFPASSDAAYFGSPAVLFGPGSLAQAHSLDEWVSIDEMVRATRVYLGTALRMTGAGEQ